MARSPKLAATLAITPARIPRTKNFHENNASPQYKIPAINNGMPVKTVTILLSTEAFANDPGTQPISYLKIVYLVTISTKATMRAKIDHIG